MLGAFEYLKLRTVDEGCHALVDAAGGGAVLAGGTDLLVEIRNGQKSPALLVDCKGLDEMRQLIIRKDGSAVVGASVAMNELIDNRAFRTAHPALADALLSIGTYALRNRATLAGNLCHASPAADSAPVLLVSDAQLEVAGVGGRRMIPIHAFFRGVKRTSLKPDEILIAVHLPTQSGIRTAFRKQQRIRGHDLAVVNVAGAYDLGRGVVRLSIGSCAPTAVLLEPIAVKTQDRTAWDAQVMRKACDVVSPISDLRASASYRLAVLPILIKRILHDLLSERSAA